MSAEENKATIRSWVEEAWNKGNMAIADEMYTATYVLHDSSGPIDGPTGLTQFITMFRNAFPDLQMTIEDQVTEGDGHRDLPLRRRQVAGRLGQFRRFG